MATTAIDSYLSIITGNAQSIFSSTAYAIQQRADESEAATDPFNRDVLADEYDSAGLLDEALGNIPDTATFAGTGVLPTTTEIDLTNSYTKRTVDLAGSELTAYEVGHESELVPVESYQPKTGDLIKYAQDVDAMVDKALGELEALPDALTNAFTENITTYHYALWQSGFLTEVQAIAADSIQGSIETETMARAGDAIALVSGLILGGLNRRGFGLPAQMIGAVTLETALLGSYMTTDIQRKIGLAAAKIAQRLLDAGVNVEQMQARFASSVNTLEVETDKIRYAAAEAEVKGSISILREGVEGLAGFIRAYINAVGVPAEWLSVEEKKLQATTQQARSWSQWTEAVTTAQKLTASTNDIHFSETDNNLQLAKIVDELDKKKASLVIEKTDASIRKQIVSKEVELETNAAQHALYAARIQKASTIMRRADAELKAYIADFTAQYTSIMGDTKGGEQLASLATLSGDLLGKIVNETQLNVTTIK